MLKNECSLKNTTCLKNLILENPELPIIIFCWEEGWSGECRYSQASATKGEIETLTLYDDCWMTKDEYEEKLSDDLCTEEKYKDLSDEEWDKMIEEKVKNTEFVKAIVIWVG